ncbi:hypothetical protein [Gordonia liuliyuniae]|uniref:DUF222 domain-containing protein n=1 Tax=Gordonia liuliyuniae TaxID=2911517 RepID=A0ABS9IT49_9ACTN|nr:hypothetical protein [Gordonia liuliyuniae]MCF8588740.1 hypothetical protein [Gordonia liuliyuniae]
MATPDPIAALAEVMVVPADAVADVLDVLNLADVALIDRPTAVVLHAAQQLAAAGIRPTAEALNGRLSQTGQYDGHRGKLVANRVLDAATTAPIVTDSPARAVLAEVVAPIAEQLLLDKLAAMGTALVEYTSDGRLYDAVAGLSRDYREVTRVHGFVRALHAMTEGAAS